MDAGGRATQGAVVERERRIKSIGYTLLPITAFSLKGEGAHT